MLIEHVANPQNLSIRENIVKLTMTLDQFHHLVDCVFLASQKTDKNSRMHLIGEMMYEDFARLCEVLDNEGDAVVGIIDSNNLK